MTHSSNFLWTPNPPVPFPFPFPLPSPSPFFPFPPSFHPLPAFNPLSPFHPILSYPPVLNNRATVFGWPSNTPRLPFHRCIGISAPPRRPASAPLGTRSRRQPKLAPTCTKKAKKFYAFPSMRLAEKAANNSSKVRSHFVNHYAQS